jgi:hypothetical protein
MDDVLDPTIVRFTPKIGVGTIGRTHEEFPRDLGPTRGFSVNMVDIDSIEGRSAFQVVLKEPGAVPPDPGLSKQLQQRSPQFSLRNVRRHVMDHNYPQVPWIIEVWRDAAEYAVEFGGEDVLTYQPAELGPSNPSRLIMNEERVSNRAVLEELDWHDYHGRWKEGLTAASWYSQHGLLEQRAKGRFAEDQGEKKVVSKPADTGFDAAQGEEPVVPDSSDTSDVDPRLAGLPDEIKKMLGLL